MMATVSGSCGDKDVFAVVEKSSRLLYIAAVSEMLETSSVGLHKVVDVTMFLQLHETVQRLNGG